MSILLIAEHNNKEVKPFTLNAISAASQINDDVHVLVLGSNSDPVAKSVSEVPNVKKVIHINNSLYENDEWLWFDIHYPIYDFINNDFKSSIKNLNSIKSQIELLEKNQYRDLVNSAILFIELIILGNDNSVSKNLSESNSKLSFKKYTPELAAVIRKSIIKSIS